MSSLHIRPDEHVFICGGTGSGKSVLAEEYTKDREYVIKLDTKDEVSERRKKGIPIWNGLQEGKDFLCATSLVDVENAETKKIIYTPNLHEQNESYYDALFEYAYNRENTAVWIDELMSICDNSRRYPLWLKGIMTRGRSKDVQVFSLSQRPSEIPPIVLGNSTHIFCFKLGQPLDKKKMSDVTGCKEMLNNPTEDHAFWYSKLGTGECSQGILKM